MNILNLDSLLTTILTIKSNLDSMLTKIENLKIVRNISVNDIEKKIIELRLATITSIINLVNIQRHYHRKYNQADVKCKKLKNLASLALYDGNENLARELLTKSYKFSVEMKHIYFCLDKISKMRSSLKKTLNKLDYELSKYK